MPAPGAILVRDRHRSPASPPEGGIFLGLGSNLGDREARLRAGLTGLQALGAHPRRISPVYATEPVGGPPQDEFLNLVVEVGTRLSPEALLDAGLRLEQDAGRPRGEAAGQRWGPRPLDIDLLVFGEVTMRTARLEIPHPRLHLRRFVLVPLVAIAPGGIHPGLRQSFAALLEECPDRTTVRLHGPAPVARALPFR